MQIYKVGGAVRDPLLGLPVKDTDWVVVGATAEEMLKAGYRQVGKDFPVFLHPQSKEEYALARTERKSGKGYTGFSVHASADVTLEEDLLRRDLTINAMAESADGQRVDPYNGKKDLANRVLRHVSPAFAEDPLRVLRVARFAARFAPLGFTVADETLDLMRQITEAGELDHLVPERVWQETSRALGEKQPGEYILVLRACGALAVLFPEIDHLFDLPCSIPSDSETGSGQHTLTALKTAAELSASVPVRFAALTHDLGKGLTHSDSGKKGAEALKLFCARLRVPNDCADLARLVILLLGEYRQLEKGNAETLMVLLEGCDALRKPERFRDFLLACEACSGTGTGATDRPCSQTILARKGLELTRNVDAKMLISKGLKGPALGEALRQARLDSLKPLFY